MIAATVPRKGPANSARGAAAFVAETVPTAQAAARWDLFIVRADSAFERPFVHGPFGRFWANAAGAAHRLTCPGLRGSETCRHVEELGRCGHRRDP